ncbi:hypothetical protein D3C85_558510 [compost metagenome]
MNRKYEALPPTLPPRGLCREAAASYIGVSASKFDEMVDDGRMPIPKRIDARKVWDRSALDAYFDALPGEDSLEINPWDQAEVGRAVI